MLDGGHGVTGPVPDVAPRARFAFPVRLLAVGASVVLLAYVPGLFTRGDVLRGALFPFLGATAAALALLVPGREGPGTRRVLVLLLPLLVAALAALSTTAPEGSDLLRHAATWAGLVALSLGLIRVWPDEDASALLFRALVWAGAAAAVWTLVDAVLRGAPGVGPFGRPGVAGPVLAALVAPALLLPRGPTWLRITLPTLIAAGCLVTASRVGILALAVSVLVAVPLGAPAGLRRRRTAIVFGALVVALGLGLAGAAALKAPTGGTTLGVRIGLWKATAQLVVERPFAGHGAGSFPTEILRVRDIEEAGISRGRRPMVAHNDLLHAAAEGGFLAGLALTAWAALLLAAGFGAWRTHAPDGLPRVLLAAGVGTLVALLVSALGEDVLLDPAGALLAAAAAATLTVCASREGERPPPGLAVLLGLLALLALGTAAVKTRDLLADTALRRYHDTLARGVDPLRVRDAARKELLHGALVWRPRHPEAWYRYGVQKADLQSFAEARSAWRKALEGDPGMTEARLDIARSYEAEDRRSDARAALIEARRLDPTRYDVHMRLGHLALGREPIPREGMGEAFDPIGAHRHYNAAERVGPDRFETWVARARIERRQGRLKTAGLMLRDADARSPKAPEILLESFRISEAEGQQDAVTIQILGLALVSNVRLAGLVEREADRFLTEGRLREEAAKRKVAGTLTPPDYATANRAFEAAATRYAALLHARLVAPATMIAAADEDTRIGGHRAAFARLLALLTWATAESAELGADRQERLWALAELRLRAAQVATRIDSQVAKAHYAEAHRIQGAYFLEKGESEAARDVLRRAAEELPKDAAIRVALARALVSTGEHDDAEQVLLEALTLAPDLKATVKQDASVRALLSRPAIADALR